MKDIGVTGPVRTQSSIRVTRNFMLHPQSVHRSSSSEEIVLDITKFLHELVQDQQVCYYESAKVLFASNQMALLVRRPVGIFLPETQ